MSCMVGDYESKDAVSSVEHITETLTKRDQSEWERVPQSALLIFVSDMDYQILNQLENSADKTLIELSRFCLGLTPYDKHQGHTPDQIQNRVFHASSKISKYHKPLISGGNIKHYWVDPIPKEWIKYGPWLGAPRDPAFFRGKRIIVRQILSGNPLRIVAGYTAKEIYHTQVGFVILPYEQRYLSALLAYLNSNLINFYHMLRFADEKKKTFNKILIQNAKVFPVPQTLLERSADFVPVVDGITEYVRIGETQKAKRLQSQIEQLINETVGLSKDQIKVVDKLNREGR